jgi:hypothetical protein
MYTYKSLNDLIVTLLGEDYTPYSLGKEFYNDTSCGVWTKFITDTSEFYYEDKEAIIENKISTWIDQCISIQIGSIVEGSDACIEVETLTFPFTLNELNQTLERIEREVEYQWKLANIYEL